MKTSAIVLLVAGVLGCAYYFVGYKSRQFRNDTERALDELAKAVDSQDREKVGQVLGAHLSDNAQIHLEVQFLSLTQNGAKPVTEDFTRKEFLTFIDNVLYPLDHYEYSPQLDAFQVTAEGDAADAQFSSSEWADGKGHYAGVTVGMRFSSDTSCDAHVAYPGRVASISKVSCTISLRSVPKPEDAYKIQENPEAMQQFLLR